MRVDGLYNARIEARDGCFSFDFEATSEDFDNEEKLTYIMGDGRKVTVV